MGTAAEEIQNGELGYQITEKPKSHELNYLVENLNSMSKNTKEQFERSYNEQVALQNERIKALQSQINPHFLNNTLEIINWEARIADNQQVSSMIEALGTMLSAAMLRSGKTKASLREELEVVDAYLYIISVRMGSGLVVKKVIDESLLDIIVPCMILQPVVENAVEHGITPRQKGELKICINMQDNLLVMEIENNGTFSEENKSNIDRLLSWNGDDEDVIRSAEVGIRNVNYRLKLLYGSDAGLSIYRTPNDTTMAKIVLPTLNTNQSQ
jgi:two-component system sensor histidine kinase YesM